MNKMTILFLSAVLLLACAKSPNPFFEEWSTPFGAPPFDRIMDSHYLPAFEKGMAEETQQIEAIASSTEQPTFENTVEAFERTGELLEKVQRVFNGVNSANTNEALQKVDETTAALLSKHNDNILLNAALFERIKAVYNQRKDLNLTVEQQQLLEKMYKNFVRSGANLNEEQKTRLRALNEELSLLTVKFGQNVLAETNGFVLQIDSESDLAGLPENVIQGAAEAASQRGLKGKWIFTLDKPSLIPFLQYAENRSLRETLFKAYIERGNNGNDQDNKAALARIAALRAEKAKLLGYETHAHFVLEENMAKTPETVTRFLMQIWEPALALAKKEAAALQAMIDQEASPFPLEPWDWWYYAEKVKKAKYDLDEEMLRPYFKLENVREGAFMVANRLWGLKFIQRDDVPKYHTDVLAFEVQESDGSHIGLLYVDYFPRASKRPGAWMDNFRQEMIRNGQKTTPIVFNVFNFSKPTGDMPALLNFEEVQTLFHEFGHGLHGLLANTDYASLSGTNVALDFVELPSQIMENWAGDPEVMKEYAKHYLTGEPIPDELIRKIKNSGTFNQGFTTVEYTAASFLDMDWHTIKEPVQDVLVFENASMERIGLIPEIVTRYRSTYFSHIFSGGYSSGYYSYIWAEILDSDAFQAFKEKSLYDPATAKSFRENVLSRGGTEEPMVLYKRFRGAEPKIDGLLKKRGLK